MSHTGTPDKTLEAVENNIEQTKEALLNKVQNTSPTEQEEINKQTSKDTHILKETETQKRLENTNTSLFLKESSENNYTDTVKRIINLSEINLSELRKDKVFLREGFVDFFRQVLSIQLIFLIMMLFLNSIDVGFNVSDKVLIAFMTSIFVETLGCVYLMVKYAFKSDEEVKIIGTLNSIVQKYQKFK